jgi:hypothetical protein
MHQEIHLPHRSNNSMNFIDKSIILLSFSTSAISALIFLQIVLCTLYRQPLMRYLKNILLSKRILLTFFRNPKCKSFCDCRLTNTCFSNKNWIIFLSSWKNLWNSFNLFISSYNWSILPSSAILVKSRLYVSSTGVFDFTSVFLELAYLLVSSSSSSSIDAGNF